MACLVAGFGCGSLVGTRTTTWNPQIFQTQYMEIGQVTSAILVQMMVDVVDTSIRGRWPRDRVVRNMEQLGMSVSPEALKQWNDNVKREQVNYKDKDGAVVDALMNKARQLETELDVTTERLSLITLQLEEKEKSLMAAEAEVNALNRRVQGLEEDLEKTEEKLLLANQKLDKAATAADDSERMKKVLANKAEEDEKRMAKLEEELKDARNQAEDADRKYEE